MNKDIAPELLEILEEAFKEKLRNNKRFKELNEKLINKEATYKEANEYAQLIGDISVEVYGENITKDILPDGRMYYNIGDKVISPTLDTDYELISEYAKEVQEILNKKSNIGLKAIKAEKNTDRYHRIVQKLADEKDFDKVKWVLKDPVRNICQSIVNDTIKENAEFQYERGLSPKIERKEFGNCCPWCKNLVGVYKYPDVPEDVYRRHDKCRCTVEYVAEDGRRQNVHTKKWTEDKENKKKIEERKKKEEKITHKNSFAQKELGKAYGGVIDKMVDKADPLTQEVYRKYEKLYQVTTLNVKGTSHYSHSDGGISINIKKEPKDREGYPKYSTFFHEVGHMIDNKSAGSDFYGSTILRGSNGKKIGATAKEEIWERAEEYRKKHNKKTKDEGMKLYISDLKKKYGRNDNRCKDLSDILEGAGCGFERPLMWGHGFDYWKFDKNHIEAFAEIFSAEMANPESLETIKTELPQTYKTYREVLKQIKDGY